MTLPNGPKSTKLDPQLPERYMDQQDNQHGPNSSKNNRIVRGPDQSVVVFSSCKCFKLKSHRIQFSYLLLFSSFHLIIFLSVVHFTKYQ